MAQRISERIGWHLERKGLLVRDLDSSHLALEPGDTQDVLTDLQGHSITYRIALGPHQGRKAFMLQSVPPREEPPGSERVAQASGFSLHAGVAAEADQRGTLERVTGLEEARAVAGIVEATITLRPGQELVPLPEGSRYLGFLFSRAEKPEDAERALREAHSKLGFETKARSR